RTERFRLVQRDLDQSDKSSPSPRVAAVHSSTCPDDRPTRTCGQCAFDGIREAPPVTGPNAWDRRDGGPLSRQHHSLSGVEGDSRPGWNAPNPFELAWPHRV